MGGPDLHICPSEVCKGFVAISLSVMMSNNTSQQHVKATDLNSSLWVASHPTVNPADKVSSEVCERGQSCSADGADKAIQLERWMSHTLRKEQPTGSYKRMVSAQFTQLIFWEFSLFSAKVFLLKLNMPSIPGKD